MPDSNAQAPQDLRPHTPRDFARLRAALGHGKRRAPGFLAQLAAERLAERMAILKFEAKKIALIGTGHGECKALLKARYPKAELVELSLRPELAPKRGLSERLFSTRKEHYPLTAYDSLPLGDASVDLVWCNLANICAQHPTALREWARVLRVGGFVAFTALGPDTGRQVAACYDVPLDLRELVDMHDWGDSLVHAGLSDPVMEMDSVSLTYTSAKNALAEFAALIPTRPRQRGLRGREKLLALVAALEARKEQGALSLSLELVFGHAFKVAEKKRGESEVSLQSLRASLPSQKAPRD